MNNNPMNPSVDAETPLILVVDDDKFTRQIMQDVIISDWMMPEMDGLDLCKWIRQNEDLKDTYFIILTAKDRLEDKTLGLEIGADDYMTKPFQGAELIARVRSGLRLRGVQKELSKAYRKLDSEFQILADLQSSLLPDPLPVLPNYDCAAHYSPSLRTSGDYYDFIPLSQIHMGILVADVSGHGAAASMVMAIMRVVMRAFVLDLLSPGGALTVVNNVLIQHVPSDQFATAFYGILNLHSNRFVYSSAGHNPAMIYRAGTGKVEELPNAGGVPLKILPDVRYEEDQLVLEKGDHILLYTDGLTEAFTPEHKMFGDEALNRLMCRYGALESKILVDEIWRSVHAFVRTEPFHDDVTLVSLRRKPE